MFNATESEEIIVDAWSIYNEIPLNSWERILPPFSNICRGVLYF